MEFSFSKRTDSASCKLWNKLCAGDHIDEIVLEVHGTMGNGKPSPHVMKYSFKLVMVQDISNYAFEGQDVIYENYVFRYGAMQIDYSPMQMDGTTMNSEKFEWSQVNDSGRTSSQAELELTDTTSGLVTARSSRNFYILINVTQSDCLEILRLQPCTRILRVRNEHPRSCLIDLFKAL